MDNKQTRRMKQRRKNKVSMIASRRKGEKQDEERRKAINEIMKAMIKRGGNL